MKTPITVSESKRLTELEKTIEAGKQTFVEVGCAIAEIRDARLYKWTHDTFDHYCRDRWGWAKSYAYNLINAANVVKALPDKVSTIVETESQARALAKLPEEKRLEVIEKVAAEGKVTAAAISEHADDGRHPRCESKKQLQKWYYKASKKARGEFVPVIFTQEVVVRSKAELLERMKQWYHNFVSEDNA